MVERIFLRYTKTFEEPHNVKGTSPLGSQGVVGPFGGGEELESGGTEFTGWAQVDDSVGVHVREDNVEGGVACCVERAEHRDPFERLTVKGPRSCCAGCVGGELSGRVGAATDDHHRVIRWLFVAETLVLFYASFAHTAHARPVRSR